MTAGAVLLAGLGLLISAAGGDDSTRYTNPVCWNEPRVFNPGGELGRELESTATRVLQITRATTTLPRPRTLSPNRAYAFHSTAQPTSGPPSGATTVSLLVFKERSYLLSIRADGVQSLQDPRWVNEKLVHFRLWLSRLGGVDVLADVEHESVVQMEAFADGRLLWDQARESCGAVPHIAACDETCIRLE